MRVEREKRSTGVASSASTPSAPASAPAKQAKSQAPAKKDSFATAGDGGKVSHRDTDGALDELVKTRAGRKKSPTVKQFRSFLEHHPDTRSAILAAAYPTFSKSAPPALGDIKKLKDGNFEVQVELHHFPDNKVVGGKSVVVSPKGDVLRVGSAGGTGGTTPADTGAPSLSAATREAVHSRWNGENPSQIEWQRAPAGLPVGVQFAREPLSTETHPDGFTCTALIPAGPLAPGAAPGDPNKADVFYVERKGGIAGLHQIAGPFPLTPGGVDLPEPRPLPPPTVRQDVHDRILAQWNRASSGQSLDWKRSDALLKPTEGYYREPLATENHPDGFSYTALIATGPLQQGVAAGDPNKAKTYYVERTGGFAGITQLCGPFQMPSASVS